MADPSDLITVRHKETREEREVARGAFDAGFWPDYEPADKKSASTARSEKKD